MQKIQITGHCAIHLTHRVLKPKRSGVNWPVLWLLMSWIVVPPDYQQPSYWLCRINWLLLSSEDWGSFCKKWNYNLMFCRAVSHMTKVDIGKSAMEYIKRCIEMVVCIQKGFFASVFQNWRSFSTSHLYNIIVRLDSTQNDIKTIMTLKRLQHT